MIFSSSDGFNCVDVLSDAQAAIEKEVVSHHPYETGGVLIGKYDENLRLATVYLATGPTIDSEHKPTTFKRGIEGIKDQITFAQQNISPKLHYIGEWHSHPNNKPYPSYTDLKQMQIFAKNRQFGIKSPLLLIVGGNPPSKLDWLFSLNSYKKEPLFLMPLH
jgi:integrative and conjugative element protein (TIGR02256 family)